MSPHDTPIADLLAKVGTFVLLSCTSDRKMLHSGNFSVYKDSLHRLMCGCEFVLFLIAVASYLIKENFLIICEGCS